MDLFSAWDRADFLDRVDGDEDLVRIMVDAFPEEAPRLAADVTAALVAGDPTAVRFAAHALRGFLLNLSAGAAARVAAAIEAASCAGDLETASRELDALGRELERAARAMAA